MSVRAPIQKTAFVILATPDGGGVGRLAIRPGARLYVYERGTTTEIDVWSAEEGGFIRAQPLSADTNGQYPNAWVDTPQFVDLYSPDDPDNPTQPWSAIVASDLGGRELAYAELVVAPGDSTHIKSGTSFQAVTGLSIAPTVGVRPIIVRYGVVVFNGTGGAGCNLRVAEGGVEIAGSRATHISSTNNAIHALVWEVRLTPSEGAHTYRLELGSTTAGSAANISFGAAIYKPWIKALEG